MAARLSLRWAAKLGYVAGMLAFLSAGTLNILFGTVRDAKLDGVEVGATAPALSLKGIRTESFQREATAWFEQRWGLRGHAVRTDNSIGLQVFGETRPGQPVVVGERGVLFNNEDTTYVNRTDSPDASIEAAGRIARVQTKMRARGKVVIPVIMPAKTSLVRDAFPTRWRTRGAFAVSDENVYGAFVRSLKEAGAVFVDGRELLAREAKRPEDVFWSTGRHWRQSAGCRVLQAAVDAARPDVPELGNDQIDCHVHAAPHPSVEAEDFDLFRLLNVWGPKPANVDVDVLDGRKAIPGLRVPTLFVGSSFVWKFVRVSGELEIFQPSLFYYYDASVVDTTTLIITKKVQPFTDDWRKDTFSARLFIVGLLESYLPEDGRRFFEEIEKEIDGRTSH